jgi:eukaryotic-like serine/threonine-protein kinase
VSDETVQNVFDWCPGASVGPYRLLRTLAKGGMGEVWLAKQPGLAGFERLVAIKRILTESDDDPMLAGLFVDEARIALQLSHANIVQVFDVGQAHGSSYLVMEYLRGQSLARVAKRLVDLHQRVPVSLSVQVVAEAAKGLGHAHLKLGADGAPLQIVHRDVSPQNLFVTYDGQVKVLDFGIAKAAGRSTRTRTGVVRGRLTYMSPEQALGEPVSPASDVFSLGIVLYELLSGARRYGLAEDIAIFRMLAEGDAPLPLTDYGIEPGLAALVHSMMAADPRARPPDGRALADLLLGWQRSPGGTPYLAVDTLMGDAFQAEVAALPEKERELESAPGTPSAKYRSNSFPDVGQPGLRRGRARRWWVGVAAVTAGVALAAFVALRSTQPEQRAEPPKALVAPTPSPVPEPPKALVVAPAPGPESPAAAVAPDAGLVAALPPPLDQAPQPPPALAPADPRAVRRGRPGTLTLQCEPYVQVFEGKKALGETPLVDVPLPAGRHRLRLLNRDANVDTVIDVTIVEGKSTTKKLSL